VSELFIDARVGDLCLSKPQGVFIAVITSVRGEDIRMFRVRVHGPKAYVDPDVFERYSPRTWRDDWKMIAR